MAQQLAIDYLDSWSAPNAVTLEASPGFYGSRVVFHGRRMSARALMSEKRRFVRRWPERRYTPRLETLLTTCDPDVEICTVRTVFDFTAFSPEYGRASRGTGTLELGVSFAGARPVIVSERSRVLHYGGGPGSALFGGFSALFGGFDG